MSRRENSKILDEWDDFCRCLWMQQSRSIPQVIPLLWPFNNEQTTAVVHITFTSHGTQNSHPLWKRNLLKRNLNASLENIGSCLLGQVAAPPQCVAPEASSPLWFPCSLTVGAERGLNKRAVSTEESKPCSETLEQYGHHSCSLRMLVYSLAQAQKVLDGGPFSLQNIRHSGVVYKQ